MFQYFPVSSLCLLVLWLLAALSHVAVTLRLSDVTQTSALQDVNGLVAAFADFNSDKATDILVLSSTGIPIA